MDAVFSWCNGAKFSDICKVCRHYPALWSVAPADSRCCLLQMTDVFEGSLIRVFRRLQELIRQMSMGTSPDSLHQQSLC